jgi:putative lipoprotein
VSSGQYQITATGRYSTTITFTGAATADVFDNKSAAVTLTEVNKSPLVFKEVYSTSYNYKLNDTYMEIVNNSDEVQYLDQVIIGAMTVLAKPNPWVDASGTQLDKYPLYGIVAAFPGTGKEHPLQPGESVVVANDAKDWSADGAANLANADWECYVPDAGQADADYDAPNLEIVYNLENQRRLGPGFFGGGLVLAKLPEGMTPSQFAANSDNFMTEPNKVDATQLYFMLPSEYLLDAVEMYDATESTHYHTLLARDDAGFAAVSGFSGKSIRRKVTKVEGGRAYYQDTNNTTNDFLTEQPLTPGVHPTQAD